MTTNGTTPTIETHPPAPHADEYLRTVRILDQHAPDPTTFPVHVTYRVLLNDVTPVRVYLRDGWWANGADNEGTHLTLTVHPDDVDLTQFNPDGEYVVRLCGYRCLIPKDRYPERIVLPEPMTMTGKTLPVDGAPDTEHQRADEWVRLTVFVATITIT